MRNISSTKVTPPPPPPYPPPAPDMSPCHKRYGNLRLWGAVGFGIASLIGGYVCDSYGGSYTGVMIVFVANVAVALAASTGVPIGRRGGVNRGTPTR